MNFIWINIGNSWNSSERSGRREPPVHRHLDRERAEDGDQRVCCSGGDQTPLSQNLLIKKTGDVVPEGT